MHTVYRMTSVYYNNTYNFTNLERFPNEAGISDLKLLLSSWLQKEEKIHIEKHRYFVVLLPNQKEHHGADLEIFTRIANNNMLG